LDAWSFIDQDWVMTTSTARRIDEDLEDRRGRSRPSLLDSYRRHRVRRQYAEAARELASYTSAAEIDELSEMISRSDSTETMVYRRVVDNMRFRAA